MIFCVVVPRKSVRGGRLFYVHCAEDVSETESGCSGFFGSQFGSGKLFYVRCAEGVSGTESGGSFFGGLKIGIWIVRVLGHLGGELRCFWGVNLGAESYFMSVARELVWERSPAEVSSAEWRPAIELIVFRVIRAESCAVFRGSIRGRKTILCSFPVGRFGTEVGLFRLF